MTATAPKHTTPRVAAQLVRNDPAAYFIGWAQWVGFHMSPLAVGWVLKLVFDRLAGDDPGIPWFLLAGIIGVEIGRWALLLSAAVQWHGAWVGWQTVPRVNMLTSLATDPGPTAHRLPGSSGEAVSRFRDDVQDVALVLDVWLDVSGAVLAASVAIAVMLTIDPLAAAATIVPVGIAALASALLGPILRAWRRAAREATGTVTSFIGDTFGSILAVKTNAAEDARRPALRRAERPPGRSRPPRPARQRAHPLARVRHRRGHHRHRPAHRRRLVPAGRAQRRRHRPVRRVRAGRGRAAPLDRPARRLPPPGRRLGRPSRRAHVRPAPPVGPAPGHHPPAPRAAPVRAAGTRPRAARFARRRRAHRGARPGGPRRARHRSRGAGRRAGGVTGQVGAGKSTLLRGLLGLVEASSGRITWNGAEVADPSSFMVPPRVAYLPQVPRLFSESLADTILLGLPDDHLHRALWLACLDEDLLHMDEGVDTIIGPRGLRLSGGQVQRTGAARALVRRPHLLVVDDLSSALDVETETRLWERLHADTSAAVLIVSHRPLVLDLADRIITLDRGRVASVT
jgi:ATP-binding cassette, subfamily B, bacterial